MNNSESSGFEAPEFTANLEEFRNFYDNEQYEDKERLEEAVRVIEKMDEELILKMKTENEMMQYIHLSRSNLDEKDRSIKKAQ